MRKVTGTGGAYSFVELEAREYTLTYAKEEYNSQSKTSNVQAGINNVVDITLMREPQIPVLKVSRESLDFGKETEPLSLDISNDGKGVLKWAITQTSDWFTCSPMAGTTEKEKSSVVVTVSRNQKEKGPYTQTFSITSDGGSRDITVTMEVGGVNLAWEPVELDFGTLTSSRPPTLTNKDAGTVDYTAETSNAWIVLGKSSGKITTTDHIDVMVNRGTLRWQVLRRPPSLFLLSHRSGAFSEHEDLGGGGRRCGLSGNRQTELYRRRRLPDVCLLQKSGGRFVARQSNRRIDR
jgi:hypothetical protein